MVRFRILLAFLVITPGLAFAQFTEEVGTLEAMYEFRARAVLNAFLRPHQYSVIVSAEIENDQKKLDEYREKVELQFIPGLPIPMDPQSVPATNDLHSMKNRVTISVVLDTAVTPEKENLLRQLLLSKLHLDESAGDAIKMSRATFPDMEPPAEKPALLPEFTWKTWAMIVLLSLLALAGVLAWLHKRAKSHDQKKEAQPIEPLSYSGPLNWPSANDNETKNSPDPKRNLDAELVEAKDQLLMLATQYPLIASRAIVDLVEEDRASVVNSFETLSWDLSRRVFAALSPSVWGKLGASIRAEKNDVPPEDALQSIQKVYRHILSRFLESGAQSDDANPFAFIGRLTPNEKRQLLANENASTFAMISLYFPADELREILVFAPEEAIELLPIELAKLQKFPESAINRLADRLRTHMKAIKESPSIFADGPLLAGRVLRGYSAIRELEVLERMRKDDPTLADKVNRVNLQFANLPLLPAELIAGAVALVDLEHIVRALFGSVQEDRDFIFGIMPVKRARMIERDLETSGLQITTAEVAEARRSICLKVEEVILSRGQTLNDLWPNHGGTLERIAG